MSFKPWPYQEKAINLILENNAVGLFLDMGLGKTVISLSALAELLHNRFESKKVLVIAPLRVAEDTWGREIDKWEHLNYLTISKVLGTQKQRLEALESQADIHIINRENVVWLVDHFKSKWPFDTVIIDELSSFKSATSKRFKALRKVRPFIKRIVGLTGTPAPNTLIDLWPQLYLLDQGERLGKTLTGYRNTYFLPDKRNQHIVYSYKLREMGEESIYEKIGDICYSMKAEDYLELPERIDVTVPVKLSEKARKQYQELEKHLILELSETDIVANNAAALCNKLLQLSNGAIYDEDKNVTELHDSKLEALEDIIENNEGKPILVFYAFKHDRDRIHKRIKARDLKTSEDIEAWNKGEVPVMITHPASSGHGLNLQAGGNIIVWFGLTWSLELYQQANARLYRQGQKNNVIIHHLVTEGTVDEDVLEALKRKDDNQETLLKALKARIESGGK